MSGPAPGLVNRPDDIPPTPKRISDDPGEHESGTPRSTKLVSPPVRLYNETNGTRDGVDYSSMRAQPSTEPLSNSGREAPTSSTKSHPQLLSPSPSPPSSASASASASAAFANGSTTRKQSQEKDRILKLSPVEIEELTSAPDSLAHRVVPERPAAPSPAHHENGISPSERRDRDSLSPNQTMAGKRARGSSEANSLTTAALLSSPISPQDAGSREPPSSSAGTLRPVPSRAISTPPPLSREDLSARLNGTAHHPSSSKAARATPAPLRLGQSRTPTSMKPSGTLPPVTPDPAPSPMPPSIPLPPLSIPTYLQLELSSSRPSPLYIHRSVTSEFPYESSKVKFDRLLNFLILPPQLEGVLWFGALACLDSWLYSFTILPLRFLKALGILAQWWGTTLLKETKDLTSFVYWGAGRMWQRRLLNAENAVSPVAQPSSNGTSRSPKPSDSKNDPSEADRRRGRNNPRKHRRSKSTPSLLLPSHKADLLKGFVVLFSCVILTRFDASRMYHGIRGQAAIKLYVIYNVLEVCDRLFSALGQDVFECLFSRETLERNPDGRSKLLRPFGMFLLALGYNVIHSTALFYQVITLNVAVNSYSNALLTLLMSNQFVEIKSTVFKKFEKENLFQLTCADVVERFQLWLMLLIIGMRNLVEVGGLTLGSVRSSLADSANSGVNHTGSSAFSGGNIIPKSFNILPKWTGQVLGPFLLVLGSEMLVDWLKHAYITKFNNTKPAIYGRFLDVLAKDYYSNAFADQNLTRRLGLPVIPLSCLFIRASLQTYHMFLATTVPLPLPSSATSLSLDSEMSSSSPAATAALAHFDNIVRRALGRSSFGAGAALTTSTCCNADDAIAFLTMLLFFLAAFLVLLALKLVLGMVLLGFARSRYKGMKERERVVVDTVGRRIGGWGVVEVDEDKKRWIYQDDPEGARASRERDKALRERGERADANFSGVSRYTMVAKRIW